MPESRLASLMRGLMEAVWLAAVCVIPLMLNPHGNHNAYQPYKFGCLSILAITGLAAWIVLIIEKRSPRCKFGEFLRSPLTVPLGILALTVGISTIFSIHLTASFWGGYETSQGVLTYIAEFALLALVACNLRTRDQLDRLVTVLLITSLPVSLCAILQRMGYDPLHPETIGVRVFSTAGHPIYLAGYLMLTSTLALWRLMALWSFQPPVGAAWTRATSITLYALVLAAQFPAMLFTESRGPLLAFGVGLFTFAVLFCAFWSLRRMTIALAVVAFLAVAAIWGGFAASFLGICRG